MSIVFPTIYTESLFLVLEHEYLEAATNPDYVAPQHPNLDAMHAGHAFEHTLPAGKHEWESVPERPDEAFVGRMRVRSGVNGVYPMARAIQAILPPMLRKYRALLPLQRWRDVCLKAMQSIQCGIEGTKVCALRSF